MVTSQRPLDGPALRDWAHTTVSDLITHIDEINQLNVFPVADSDTGANMLFTMRAALAQVDAEAGKDTDADVARVAAALSAGAVTGARGNSGVILSQILLGIAEVTADAADDSGGVLPTIDAATLGAALWRGLELVVASMGGDEVPGTIVSVLRAAATAVEQSAAAGDTLPRAVIDAGDAAVVALERPPSSSTCSPTQAWWTPAGGVCWSCWIHCARPSPAACRRGAATSRRHTRGRPTPAPAGRLPSSR